MILFQSGISNVSSISYFIKWYKNRYIQQNVALDCLLSLSSLLFIEQVRVPVISI